MLWWLWYWTDSEKMIRKVIVDIFFLIKSIQLQPCTIHTGKSINKRTSICLSEKNKKKWKYIHFVYQEQCLLLQQLPCTDIPSSPPPPRPKREENTDVIVWFHIANGTVIFLDRRWKLFLSSHIPCQFIIYMLCLRFFFFVLHNDGNQLYMNNGCW